MTIEIHLKKNARNTFLQRDVLGDRIKTDRHPYRGLSRSSDRQVNLTGSEHRVFAQLWRAKELIGRQVSRQEARWHGDHGFYQFGGAEISASEMEKTGLLADIPLAETAPAQKLASLADQALAEWSGACPICGKELKFLAALKKARCPDSAQREHRAQKQALIDSLPAAQARKLEGSAL